MRPCPLFTVAQACVLLFDVLLLFSCSAAPGMALSDLICCLQDNDARLVALQELSTVPLQDISKIYLEQMGDKAPKEVGLQPSSCGGNIIHLVSLQCESCSNVFGIPKQTSARCAQDCVTRCCWLGH